MNKKRYRKLLQKETDDFSKIQRARLTDSMMSNFQNGLSVLGMAKTSQEADTSNKLPNGGDLIDSSFLDENQDYGNVAAMHNQYFLWENRKLECKVEALKQTVSKYSKKNFSLRASMKKNKNVDQIKAIKQDRFEWQMRCQKAEERLELLEDVEEVVHQKQQLEQTLKEAHNQLKLCQKENEAELNENQRLRAEIEKRVKEKFKEYGSSQLQGSEQDFKTLFTMMNRRIENILECPLTRDRIKTPMILPSGNTIDKSFMDYLVPARKPDPFDKTKICDRRIHNLFVSNVIDIMDEVHEYIKNIKSESPEEAVPIPNDSGVNSSSKKKRGKLKGRKCQSFMNSQMTQTNDDRKFESRGCQTKLTPLGLGSVPTQGALPVSSCARSSTLESEKESIVEEQKEEEEKNINSEDSSRFQEPNQKLLSKLIVGDNGVSEELNDNLSQSSEESVHQLQPFKVSLVPEGMQKPQVVGIDFENEDEQVDPHPSRYNLRRTKLRRLEMKHNFSDILSIIKSEQFAFLEDNKKKQRARGRNVKSTYKKIGHVQRKKRKRAPTKISILNKYSGSKDVLTQAEAKIEQSQ
ncbi:unnamed protein product [Moneuplotes crassus]|uniref:Uncharacterized protein n=1 Tax=Euplotes crassus TaxID=5936 RepID=A0AAD1U488_EUPCR|nr:unnamed protein product [Moneuplotes crassus]